MEVRVEEKLIEQKLVAEVKKRGGICPKWVSTGFVGVPDRLVFLPDGKFAMVEVKSTGKKPRPIQIARHKCLKDLGFQVYILDEIEQIGGILNEIQGT